MSGSPSHADGFVVRVPHIVVMQEPNVDGVEDNRSKQQNE
jgi:hypothetical protein